MLEFRKFFRTEIFSMEDQWNFLIEFFTLFIRRKILQLQPLKVVISDPVF